MSHSFDKTICFDALSIMWSIHCHVCLDSSHSKIASSILNCSQIENITPGDTGKSTGENGVEHVRASTAHCLEDHEDGGHQGESGVRCTQADILFNYSVDEENISENENKEEGSGKLLHQCLCRKRGVRRAQPPSVTGAPTSKHQDSWSRSYSVTQGRTLYPSICSSFIAFSNCLLSKCSSVTRSTKVRPVTIPTTFIPNKRRRIHFFMTKYLPGGKERTRACHCDSILVWHWKCLPRLGIIRIFGWVHGGCPGSG